MHPLLFLSTCHLKRTSRNFRNGMLHNSHIYLHLSPARQTQVPTQFYMESLSTEGLAQSLVMCPSSGRNWPLPVKLSHTVAAGPVRMERGGRWRPLKAGLMRCRQYEVTQSALQLHNHKHTHILLSFNELSRLD